MTKSDFQILIKTDEADSLEIEKYLLHITSFRIKQFYAFRIIRPMLKPTYIETTKTLILFRN